MLTIIFESHATTHDNEAKLSSGWNDVDLSELGLSQAEELAERYAGKAPDAVYCSDLQRSYKTAAITFRDVAVPIYIDSRLRECNYGELTQAPSAEVKAHVLQRIAHPFPGGESYQDTSRRMKAFLADLKARHDGQTVMIIGHRATQYGLEEHILGKPLAEIVVAPWQWQPGWTYSL